MAKPLCKALRSANHTFVLGNAREFLFFHPRVVGHYPHIFALFIYRPSVLLLIWMRLISRTYRPALAYVAGTLICNTAVSKSVSNRPMTYHREFSVLYFDSHKRSSPLKAELVTPTRFELVLPPWKGGVLTIRRWRHIDKRETRFICRTVQNRAEFLTTCSQNSLM